MKRVFNLIAILPIALSALAGVPDTEGKTALRGTVFDKANGETIPGAEVYFPDLRTGTVTDINGRYAIHGLPKAKALISVSMVGYATLTRTIDLSTSTTMDFTLSESVTEMHDVVVTGTSKATELKRSPIPMAMVSRSFLRENASTNAIEALARVPGVSTVSTGPNVSKPYIRGLGGNRVLTLFDGVRQEGQQWGDEHGVEVDQNLVDRVEVVKGPASLMYGSDALAGVVNLLPAPPAPVGTLRGSMLGAYDTNNKGIGGSVNIDGNNGKLLYGGRISGKIASDYQNRYDGRVYATKFNEKDIDGYAGVNRAWGFVRLNVSAYDDLQEIPDGSRDSTSRSFTYQVDEADSARPIVPDPVLNSYHIATLHQHVQYYRAYSAANFNLGNSRIATNLGYSRSIRREFNHPEYADIAGLYLVLNTFSYDVKLHLPERNGWEPTLGLNGMVQANDASKGTEFVVPGYHRSDLGPFVYMKKSAGRIDISGGLRVDLRDYDGEALYTRKDPRTGFDMSVDPLPGDTGLERRFEADAHSYTGGSGSIGAAWRANDRLTLKANIGRGYRAPSVAETSAYGVHPGTGQQQVGDGTLKPEFNLQLDLGAFYSGTHVTASAEAFHNTVSDYIYNEKLANVSGGDSLFTQDGTAYPVFKYRQTTALLYGGEVSIDIHPHPLDRLHFENTLSMVYAVNRGGNGALIDDSTRYLPLIPPVHATSELRWDMPKGTACFKHMFAKVGVQLFAAQNRFFGAYGTETYTPGYTLLDAGIGADVVDGKGHTVLTVTILGSNLADVAYQSNMSRLKYMDDYPVNGTGRSGIYNMGRNVSIKVVVPFGLSKEHAPVGP